MKKLSCFILILLAIAPGCKRDNYQLYNDIARIQLADTATLNTTFYFYGPEVTRDTVYIPVNTIGGIAPQDRAVKLEQVPEYDYTYARDPVTNEITDTIATEKPFKAVPGVHYVPLDDASIASLMVVRANNAAGSLPIVLLRDASMKDNTYRLRIRIVANDGFAIGETKAIERTIIISDRLERFYSWRVDATNAPAFITFGKYSVGKHQFMCEALNVNVNEEWYQAALAVQALGDYVVSLKDALARFNADPANILSGKAPLRENPNDPNSLVVSFP